MFPRYLLIPTATITVSALVAAGCTSAENDSGAASGSTALSDSTAASNTGGESGSTGESTSGSGASSGTESDSGNTTRGEELSHFPILRTSGSGRGARARLAYEVAFDNVNGGDWYLGENNEERRLAWGTSYIMMGLAAMFRATGDVTYLDRLARQADAVLEQRDDRRGVHDYRDESAACWRDLHNSGNYLCYVVHSGMIAAPFVEFSNLVEASGLGEEVAYDGVRFADKATDYVAAGRETVLAHEDQWNPQGFYITRSDATFLPTPGEDIPFNQSNVMGRLLLGLYQATGDSQYLERATILAERFKDALVVGEHGEYLWEYWGMDYEPPGEDVSHGAHNVDFAVASYLQGIVFNEDDLAAFGGTFVDNMLIDDRNVRRHIDGGDILSNATGWLGWLRASPYRPALYTTVRDAFERHRQPENVNQHSYLLGWALLAEFELPLCEHSFASLGWSEPNEGWRQATAYGANILVAPPDASQTCMMRVEVNAARPTQVQQYDGETFHTVSRWSPTEGEVVRHISYNPRWDHDYWKGQQLYQFRDEWLEGSGILVKESEGLVLPTITSDPPSECEVGQAIDYTPTSTATAPHWSLVAFPPGARIDPFTGKIHYTPMSAGIATFTLQVQTDVGNHQQTFELSCREA